MRRHAGGEAPVPSRYPLSRSDDFCYLFDIFATLGELAKVAAPAGAERRSLAPLLTGQAMRARESIFTNYADVQRAVRDSRWKFITYPAVKQSQLFDLQNDPEETRNFASIDTWRTAPPHAPSAR